VLACEARKVLVRVRVVFADFLDDVLADVGVVFLDLFRAASGRSAELRGPAARRPLTPAADPREGCAPVLRDLAAGSRRIR
jgi:hypothetical protein